MLSEIVSQCSSLKPNMVHECICLRSIYWRQADLYDIVVSTIIFGWPHFLTLPKLLGGGWQNIFSKLKIHSLEIGQLKQLDLDFHRCRTLV